MRPRTKQATPSRQRHWPFTQGPSRQAGNAIGRSIKFHATRNSAPPATPRGRLQGDFHALWVGGLGWMGVVVWGLGLGSGRHHFTKGSAHHREQFRIPDTISQATTPAFETPHLLAPRTKLPLRLSPVLEEDGSACGSKSSTITMSCVLTWSASSVLMRRSNTLGLRLGAYAPLPSALKSHAPSGQLFCHSLWLIARFGTSARIATTWHCRTPSLTRHFQDEARSHVQVKFGKNCVATKWSFAI